MKARILSIFGVAALVSLAACSGGGDAEGGAEGDTVPAADTSAPVITPPPAPITPPAADSTVPAADSTPSADTTTAGM